MAEHLSPEPNHQPKPTELPTTRAIPDNELHLNLLLNSFALVEEYNSKNSTQTSIDRISTQATIQDLIYRYPDADRSDLYQTSENNRRKMIQPYIHNSQQYYPESNINPDGSTFDHFLSEAIRIETEKQNFEAEQLTFFTGFNLAQVGLSLELVTVNSNIVLSVANQNYRSQNLEFNLNNAPKYLSFLNRLNPSDISQNSFDSHLEKIGTSLANQLLKNYNLYNPNDQTLELIINLQKITAEYQRLGIKGESLLLSDLSKLYQGGILREYISAFRSGLLPTNQSVPQPEDWHFIYQTEQFLQKWNQTLDTLKQIKRNPKAKDLYGKIKANLLNSIELSCSKIEASRTKNNVFDQKYLNILSTVKEELEDM